jgi:putative transposase
VALDQSALLEVLDARKTAEVSDRVRQATQTIYQALIHAELTSVIGAAPSADQGAAGPAQPASATAVGGHGWGSGAADPQAVGGVVLPQLVGAAPPGRPGLFAVVMEAYLHGVSTRKVDDLVRALGADRGISKSEVSRSCADLDAEVSTFCDRSLAGQAFPYVFVDATHCKARVNRRVVAQAVVVPPG